MWNSFKDEKLICIDLETKDEDLKENGPGYHRSGSFIAGIAIATPSGRREYYPIAHEAGENLDREKVLAFMREELSTDIPKVGANILYDAGFLHCAGVPLGGLWFDVLSAEALLREDRLSYSLDAVSKDYLGEGKVDDALDAFLIQHFGKKNPKANIWRAPGDIVAPYAIGDVDITLRTFELQRKKLEDEGLWDLFLLETKLLPMLLAMRLRGVRVDIPKAEELYERLGMEITEKNKEIEKIAGRPLSIWAAADLAHAFDDAGLSYPLTEKTRKPSITATLLERTEHPLAKLIVDVRKADKFRETFLLGSILEKHYNGRVHCQFNPLKSEAGGTISGRFSSSNPNLQFIPTRTETGKLVRSLFIADEGEDMFSLDYSQIEYRLLAHYAYEYKLPGAEEVFDKYRENEKLDFHQAMADLTGLPRSSAKTIVFGIAYGQGVNSLKDQLGISQEAAERLLGEFHKRAPFVRALSQRVQNQTSQYGVIRTLLGRKRRFDSWVIIDKSGSPVILKKRVYGAKRAFVHKSLNALIQGSAADVMKKAMLDVWESGICDTLGVPAITCHDELVGSIPQDKKSREAVKELIYIMSNTVKLHIPLLVDGNIGANWAECK